ncbi:Uncharacterised protein [Mycobacteroides abscessus subsp. abscessus]|nr:Uncharacterised protein [Mycobacteroides abscessus subsp. abscessus]
MIIVRPGAHLSTTAAGQASPTTASAVDSRPSGESIATADGVWVRTVTCSATSRSWKSAGEAVIDSGTTASRPPRSSAPQISQTETSKAREWHNGHTPGLGKPASNDCINCVTLWCVTATPLGAPVVPEV